VMRGSKILPHYLAIFNSLRVGQRKKGGEKEGRFFLIVLTIRSTYDRGERKEREERGRNRRTGRVIPSPYLSCSSMGGVIKGRKGRKRKGRREEEERKSRTLAWEKKEPNLLLTLSGLIPRRGRRERGEDRPKKGQSNLRFQVLSQRKKGRTSLFCSRGGRERKKEAGKVLQPFLLQCPNTFPPLFAKQEEKKRKKTKEERHPSQQFIPSQTKLRKEEGEVERKERGISMSRGENFAGKEEEKTPTARKRERGKRKKRREVGACLLYLRLY